MNKYLILFFAVLFVSMLIIFFVFNPGNLHITAVFKELEPFAYDLNVYYKGYKLGHTTKIHPSADFASAYVEMVLNGQGVCIPGNVTAKIRRKDKVDYVELIYQGEPYSCLKNHSVIEGTKGKNFEDFLHNQAEEGGFDEIRSTLNAALQSAGETFDAISGMIQVGTEILTDLKPSLKESGESLARASKNLEKFTQDLNSAANTDRLNKTFNSIEKASQNLEYAGANVNNITKNADTKTVILTNCLLKNANTVIRNINTVIININDIVTGLKYTLSKRFAGMRMFLGKPLG